MPVTAQWLFERAIALMDEGDERTGAMDTGETKAYKHRTLSILNVLGEECREAFGGKGPWRELTEFDQALCLPGGPAREVLPYGLAAHLFLEEDPAAANFFQQRYEELLERHRRRAGAAIEAIAPPYGGLDAPGDWGWPLWR